MPGPNRIRHYVAARATGAATVLRDHFGLPPEEIALLLDLGAVYLDRRRLLADAPVPAGGYLRIHLAPRRYRLPETRWRERVVAESADYLVIDKPPGLPVHPLLDNARENVVEELRRETGLELRVTQRLDVDTEGLLVLARSRDSQRRFNRFLSERRVRKTYRAWVLGVPAAGRLVHYMRPDPAAPKTVSPEPQPGWARCELSIERSDPVGAELDGRPVTELRIDLATGRTHQIRVQLATVGHPVLGDWMYGDGRRVFGLLALQACGLQFPAPGERPATFSLERPPAWAAELARQLGPAGGATDPV